MQQISPFVALSAVEALVEWAQLKTWRRRAGFSLPPGAETEKLVRRGDEPPEAGRQPGADHASAPTKHRRRKRRGKRTRWPSLAKSAPAGAERPPAAERGDGESPGSGNAGFATERDAKDRAAPRSLASNRDLGPEPQSRPRAAGANESIATADCTAARTADIAAAPARAEEIAAAQGRSPVDPGPSTARSGEIRQPPRRPARNAPGDGRDVGAGSPRRGDRGPDAPPLYAALDLGTNNCRLLVAEPWHQSFRVVDAFSRIVRLGEGLSRTGRLSDAAQDRAIDALRVCRGKLDARGIVRARLVATEACRAAENGLEFLARVEDEAGLALEILTRETEARLAVAGCANLVDWRSDGVLLFDIGGGSSELVWLEFAEGRRHGGDPTRHIRAWTSLPVGVVTLSERHGGVAVGRDVFEDMVADVSDLLARHADWAELDERHRPERYHMLGTSGTVTTLAGVHLGLKRYDRRRVDGTWLDDGDVGAMIGRLLDMDFEDRVANPCIGGDRADLVLAGCAILEAIRRRWRCDRLRVADRGLREGMLTELMIGDGVWRRANRWPRRG